VDRRRLLAGFGAGLAVAPLAVAACGRAQADPAPADIPPLKSLAPFPLGVAAMTEQFADPVWDRLVRAHFDRVTPEWEMKAESVVDGSSRMTWTRADQIVSLASSRGLTTFGHALVWYEQVPATFKALEGDRARFALAYREYVYRVARRYAGKVVGWDVVNEAVSDDGSGYRMTNAWARNLGLDYVRLAFEHAREADPQAVLFLNDYNLEQLPRKRADFLRLAEGLLNAGVPLGGLGTQTHVPADLPAGAIARTVRELGALGLPVHISELDVSLNRAHRLASADALEGGQRRIVAEAAQAVLDLPAAQRFGLTLWGARDTDSWLNRRRERNPARPDRPLLFDDQGRPKPMARALADALRA
jgi:endo-1,4-beta-xylanase